MEDEVLIVAKRSHTKLWMSRLDLFTGGGDFVSRTTKADTSWPSQNPSYARNKALKEL